MLTTWIGSLVGGAFSGLGSVIDTVGQTAATTATPATPAIANHGLRCDLIEDLLDQRYLSWG